MIMHESRKAKRKFCRKFTNFFYPVFCNVIKMLQIFVIRSLVKFLYLLSHILYIVVKGAEK